MGLLGHALSRAAGVPLPQLMEQRIFEPLGMRSTGYGGAGEDATSLVAGHQLRDTVPHWTETEAIGGAGGLRSSAEDLLRYLDANIGPPQSDLERAMRAAHEPRRPEGAGDERIGLAWVTSTANGHTIVRPSGGTGGFRSELAFDPERGVGIVVLANSSAYNDNLGENLIAAGPPPSLPEVDVAAETLGSYPGSYQSANGLPLYIDVDGEGHLTGQAPSQTRFRLYATSDSTFYAKRVPFELTFNRSGDGEVEDLVLAVGANTNRFERVGDDVPRSDVIAGHDAGTITAEDIARYEGTYIVEIQGQPTELRVYGEDGRLMANLGNQTISRLLPRGDHEFVPAAGLQARVVFDVEDGRARTVTMIQNRQTVTGERRR